MPPSSGEEVRLSTGQPKGDISEVTNIKYQEVQPGQGRTHGEIDYQAEHCFAAFETGVQERFLRDVGERGR